MPKRTSLKKAAEIHGAQMRIAELEDSVRFLLRRTGPARSRTDWMALEKCRSLLGVKI
jgi:hypothetical protein